MFYTTVILAALSLDCAFAQPAHHRHQHKQRGDVDWNTVSYDLSGVNWNTVNYGGGSAPAATPVAPGPPLAQSPKAAVQATSTAVVVPIPAKPSPSSSTQSTKNTQDTTSGSTSGSSSNAGIVSGAKGGAKGSFGGVSTPVNTGDRITYIGNVGVPYGSNMMYVSEDQAKSMKYTIKFSNTGSNPLPVNVWNKAGRDGQANSGGCTAPNLKFTLPKGGVQFVAFDENTQGAFSRDCPAGPGGYPSCAWGEFDFGDQRPDDATGQGNHLHSGFDRSSIPGGAGEVLSMSCENCGNGGDQTSSREGNDFTSSAQLSAGGQAQPGPAHFLAEMAI